MNHSVKHYETHEHSSFETHEHSSTALDAETSALDAEMSELNVSDRAVLPVISAWSFWCFCCWCNSAVCRCVTELLIMEIWVLFSDLLSVWGFGLLELCGKITVKIKRAFSVISWALPAVGVTYGNSPAFVSEKSFSNAKLGSRFRVTGGCLEWLHGAIILILLHHLKVKTYRVLKKTFNSNGILIAW